MAGGRSFSSGSRSSLWRGFAAALAPSFALLLIARFVEGCGAGAGLAMNFAIIRDLFEGSKARTRLAYVGMVTNVAPMIAPALGSAMLTVAPWRAIYLTLGLAGLALLATIIFGLDESHKMKDPRGAIAAPPRRRLCARLCDARRDRQRADRRGELWLHVRLYLRFRRSHDASARPSRLCLQRDLRDDLGRHHGRILSQQPISRRHLPAMIPMTAGFSLSLATALLLVALTLGNAVSVALFLPLFIIASISFGLVAPNAIAWRIASAASACRGDGRDDRLSANGRRLARFGFGRALRRQVTARCVDDGDDGGVFTDLGGALRTLGKAGGAAQAVAGVGDPGFRPHRGRLRFAALD